MYLADVRGLETFVVHEWNGEKEADEA